MCAYRTRHRWGRRNMCALNRVHRVWFIIYKMCSVLHRIRALWHRERMRSKLIWWNVFYHWLNVCFHVQNTCAITLQIGVYFTECILSYIECVLSLIKCVLSCAEYVCDNTKNRCCHTMCADSLPQNAFYRILNVFYHWLNVKIGVVGQCAQTVYFTECILSYIECVQPYLV